MRRSIKIIMHQHSSLSRWLARVHRLCTGRHFNIWTFQRVIQLPLWLPGGAKEYISDFDASSSINFIIMWSLNTAGNGFTSRCQSLGVGAVVKARETLDFSRRSRIRAQSGLAEAKTSKKSFASRLSKSEIAAKTYKRQITHKFCPQPISVVILQLQKSTHV